MPGLDPGIQLKTRLRHSLVDCRVEPGNDERARSRERRLPPSRRPFSFVEGHVFVMPGLDPGIHPNPACGTVAWIAGSSPAMTRGCAVVNAGSVLRAGRFHLQA